MWYPCSPGTTSCSGILLPDMQGKAALEIRKRGSTGGTVFHNHPNGTRLYCANMIKTLLPAGAQLTVMPPSNAVAKDDTWCDETIVRTGDTKNPKGL